LRNQACLAEAGMATPSLANRPIVAQLALLSQPLAAPEKPLLQEEAVAGG